MVSNVNNNVEIRRQSRRNAIVGSIDVGSGGARARAPVVPQPQMVEALMRRR